MEKMTTFDKNYFDLIWSDQGVHRHDYCEFLASQLIQKYGQCKILDIGTGCGFLVKTLRDKGADAWGLEISDYAIENTCAKGYVLKGDVRNIPYASGFDVVFSQGLWEYIPEEDIQKAWKECQRVGDKQEHRIDTTQCEYHDNFATYKSQEWWDIRLKRYKDIRVLIACPNYEGKEYSFQKWIDTVNKLEWSNKEVLVVDNSTTVDFYNRWKDKVSMIHLDLPNENGNRRIAISMDYIRTYFLKGDFDYWFNLESDIIVPSHTLKYFMNLGHYDWYEHHYPYRNRDSNDPAWRPVLSGFGCTIFSKYLMEGNDFEGAPEISTTDGYFWNKKVCANPNYLNYKVVEAYNVLDIQHLALEGVD